MSVSSFFSSFLNTVHGDAPEEKQPESEPKEEEVAEAEEPSKESEETEEVEDIHPVILEECKNSAACASLTRHFEHCQEKVQSGHGFKGEDCVEEL
ncbi:hypothetical protein M405DRAFT_859809 [Rhizopogon salebrosus TDB-379]|nr:hypothetical protein M405DRAFT_859809 [Rhizopogon salebrosus TDB-379]